MPEECPECGVVGDVEITREPGRLVGRCLVCNHLTSVLDEAIVTSASLGVVKLDPNPVILLRKMIDAKDYFKAIVVAGAYLEYYGLVKLLNYQKSVGIIIGLEKLKRLQLGEIILFLRGSNLIDQTTLY